MDKETLPTLAALAMLQGRNRVPRDLDKISSSIDKVEALAEGYAPHRGPVLLTNASVQSLREDSAAETDRDDLLTQSKYVDEPYVVVPRVV